MNFIPTEENAGSFSFNHYSSCEFLVTARPDVLAFEQALKYSDAYNDTILVKDLAPNSRIKLSLRHSACVGIRTIRMLEVSTMKAFWSESLENEPKTCDVDVPIPFGVSDIYIKVDRKSISGSRYWIDVGYAAGLSELPTEFVPVNCGIKFVSDPLNPIHAAESEPYVAETIQEMVEETMAAIAETEPVEVITPPTARKKKPRPAAE